MQLHDWVKKTFVDEKHRYGPAHAVREQLVCNCRMAGHSGHWASLLGSLYQATGEEKYRTAQLNVASLITYPWKGGGYTIATPLVHGDRVLLSVFPRDGLSLMLQLTSSGPKEVWKTSGMGLLFHSGVLVDGHVYGPYSREGEADTTLLQCVSWDTGEVKWTHAGFGFSPLIAADGKLILITDDGELVVAEASPKAYLELARAKVFPSKSKSWVCPVLCSGRIYCRHGENVVCLDVKGQ
jgi:outer membrane protein assembly factor BamB